jgi:polysaccharide pyruvyl transferase WcaK-like protein
MTIGNVIKTYNLEKSLLIGFYGGGNYGDELLMEILSGLLYRRGVKNVSVAYRELQTFETYHHNFGYKIFNIHHTFNFLKEIINNKNLIIGGGGLWGRDVNSNILFLSILLFLSRWLLGKKVYLLGVGYYNSTNKLGHLSAFFAAHAANLIIGRDTETVNNFSRHSTSVYLDTDIAWYIKDLDVSIYESSVKKLEQKIGLDKHKTIVITLRRFNSGVGSRFEKAIEMLLQQYTHTKIVLLLMEPQALYPQGYELIKHWAAAYPNVTAFDFSFNPLAFFLFFKRNHNRLIFIGPQYHGIISAHLNGVPFLPIAYDNKVTELLRDICPRSGLIAISRITFQDVRQFVDGSWVGDVV